MKRLLAFLWLAVPVMAADLEFREAFADPERRAGALERLVPGTRDAFFYRALDHQLARRVDAFEAVIAEWERAVDSKAVSVSSEGLEVLKRRELLLGYEADPEGAVKRLIEELELKFDDTRPDARADERLADRLDAGAISREAFMKEAVRVHGGQSAYVANSQELLLEDLPRVAEFDQERGEFYLNKLDHAEHPAVVMLVLKALADPDGVSFGGLPIHGELTLQQMEALLAGDARLLGNMAFAVQYLSRMMPGAEVDFERDRAAHAAHLVKCRDFVMKLPPALNSLKAHVLYHHLRLQRELGDFPLEDFKAFLDLPRRGHGILQMREGLDGGVYVQMGVNYDMATACPPVNEDEELVEALLMHHLAGAEKHTAFSNWIDDKKLRQIHARARLFAGGDLKEWGEILPPAEVMALQEEVRVAFAPGQVTLLGADDEVKLAMDLKNTRELTVRIYELDLPTWVAREKSAPPVDLDLDGLVPHHERKLKYAQEPLMVHREVLEFPEMKGAGAWVVECVSGSVASRALVRKGQLMPYLTRNASSQEVRVFDEKGGVVEKAEMVVGAEVFMADARGVIVVPNAERDGRRDAVVRYGKLAEPFALDERTDDLRLDVGFHLDREQLLAEEKGVMFLRLQLSSHGYALPLDRVTQPVLTFKSLLANGTTVERVVTELGDLHAEMSVGFQVPADTVRFDAVLTGMVVVRDGEEAIPVKAEFSRDLNRMVKTGKIGAILFTRDAGGYQLEVRGRNGEPMASQALTVAFTHRDVNTGLTFQLRTNEEGRLLLGEMPGIVRVVASGSGLDEAVLRPEGEMGEAELPSLYQVAVGEEIRVPLVRPMGEVTRSRVGLLETRGGEVRRDHFDRVAMDGDVLLLRDLPAGDYQLRVDERRIVIRVTGGVLREELLVSTARIFPRHAPGVPIIREAVVAGENLVVTLDRAVAGTRVTLAGRYFLHGWNAGDGLQPFRAPVTGVMIPSMVSSGTLEDRRLGDEMRYILDRRAATTFPGVMLPRPGQLVRRWSEQDLEQTDRVLEGAEDGGMDAAGAPSRRLAGDELRRKRVEMYGGDWMTLDFLGRTSVMKYVMEVGADGVVSVPLAEFGGCRLVEVTVANAEGHHVRVVPLAAAELPMRERTLARALDVAKHHVGTRRAAVLKKDAVAEIENVIDAEWRAFTTLDEAHAFLSALVVDPRMEAFRPLVRWPELKEEEKLAFLEEHACHEVHWFLARKDAEFFQTRVVPMLKEKKEPTVMDDLLLGRDLTKWLRPYAWLQLNAAEKALLAWQLPEDGKRILMELEQRWELEAPSAEAETLLFTKTLRGALLSERDSLGLAARAEGIEGGGGLAFVTNKLRSIIIPRIDFEDTTLEEAVDFLRLRAVELDHGELDPARKGMNFVIRRPRMNGGDAGLDAALGGGGDPGVIRIKELRLRNVPLAVALKYICDATKMRYKVDDYAVTLIPQTETGEDNFSRTFRVPPDLVDSLRGAEGGSDGDVDPFAEPGDGGSSPLRPRKPIIELLRDNGINFGEGTSATLTPSGALVVTNTPSELDKIEQLTDALVESSMSDIDPFADEGGAGLDSGVLADLELPELMDSVKSRRGRATWSGQRDQTRLWWESNYDRYHGDTGERFIGLNRFWVDLAGWGGKGEFLSPHFNACTGSVNEAVLCLAMLDLPFAAERPETKLEGGKLRVTAKLPMLLFYQDTRETEKIAADAPVLLRQTFHGLNDRFRQEGGREVENVVTGDFVAGVPYAASLVVMNPTGTGRRVDVLAQIPAGAIPLAGEPSTLAVSRDLAPNGVLNFDLAFYFPSAGEYSHYPLQVSEGDLILARAPGNRMRVSDEAGAPDAESWPVVARDGSDEVVLQRLASAPLAQMDLGMIRWRLRNAEFFKSAAEILRKRLGFSTDLLSFGFAHGSVAEMRDYLETSLWREQVGSWLDSPLLTVRPQEHLGWEILEFDPLVNPRAHAVVNQRRLTHEDAARYYEEVLEHLSWKAAWDAEDHLTMALHLMLQDRIEEGLARFDRIDAEKLRGRMAYDYLRAVVLFHRGVPGVAREIAQGWVGGASGVWRERFEAVVRQADEIEALAVPRAAEEEVEKEVAPFVELALAEGGMLRVEHRRMKAVTLKFFSVDLEVMFTKEPFLAGGGSDAPGIQPNGVLEVELDVAKEFTLVPLPEAFRKGSVLVEAEGDGVSRLRVLDSRAMELVRNPALRRVQVFDGEHRTPIGRCYVKVFVEGMDGTVRFHKDGYTDLRGMFDYGSSTGDAGRNFRRFSIFVSHPEMGGRIEVVDG
jgi:hypothetical protein